MKVCLTNGCFDILHVGHVRLLQKCRELVEPDGQVWVALNTDESVARLKPGRPILPYAHRKEMLLAMRGVYQVIGFDQERELFELIERLRPDFLVKGPGVSSFAKQSLLAQWGGQYLRMDVKDDGTSAIIERIRTGL